MTNFFTKRSWPKFTLRELLLLVACAAVAGCILTPMYYTFPTVGVDLIIIAFVVVVLGGMGSVAGAMVGGLIIGITQTLTGFFVSVELKDVIALLLFILILLVRPPGLFGRAGTEAAGIHGDRLVRGRAAGP